MKFHHRISLHFLIAGHTKFAPDRCFGLLKQCFGQTAVSSLQELCTCIENSTCTGVNKAQLVGTENGPSMVPLYDWQLFLTPMFKALPGIKNHHHFTFSSASPGVVTFQEFVCSELKSHKMLKIPLLQVSILT